mgnify:FL=1
MIVISLVMLKYVLYGDYKMVADAINWQLVWGIILFLGAGIAEIVMRFL